MVELARLFLFILSSVSFFARLVEGTRDELQKKVAFYTMEQYLDLAMAAIAKKAEAERSEDSVGSDDESDASDDEASSTSAAPGRFVLRRDWSLNDGTEDVASYLDLSGVGKRAGATDKLLPGTAAVRGVVVLDSKARASMASTATIDGARKAQEIAAHARQADRDWFNMRTPNITPEIEHDLDVLHMRRYLDPKNFYKGSHNDRKVRENFEVGTIIEGKGEYFSARIPRAERKQRMVDELLANRTFRDYAKRKFGELQSASGAGQQGKRGKPRKRPKTYRTAAAKKRR